MSKTGASKGPAVLNEQDFREQTDLEGGDGLSDGTINHEGPLAIAGTEWGDDNPYNSTGKFWTLRYARK